MEGTYIHILKVHFLIFFRIARFLRQSFRQSIRRFRGESVDAGGSTSSNGSISQTEANLRGRQARGKLNPELNFSAPPDYATVIIETQRHSQLNNNNLAASNSDSGSFNASQDLATTSSIVSSELPLVESLHRSAAEVIQPASPLIIREETTVKRDSVHSQSFR